MPDDMDANYAPNYPNAVQRQPHMHPGTWSLSVHRARRFQHPFHEHGNHVRIFGPRRESDPSSGTTTTNAATALLAGRMEFTTDTTPGQAFDGIFYWSGKASVGISTGTRAVTVQRALRTPTATTRLAPRHRIYYEWCADHNPPGDESIGNVAGRWFRDASRSAHRDERSLVQRHSLPRPR